MAAANGLKRALIRLFLLALPMLLLLQLLFCLTVPRALGSSSGLGPGSDPGFTVISIEGSVRLDRSPPSQAGGAVIAQALHSNGREKLWDEEELTGPAGYQDENEAVDREEMKMQPWASGQPSFSAEVRRLIHFISIPQMNCSAGLQGLGEPPHVQPSLVPGALCMDHWHIRESCATYSFSLDGRDTVFLESALRAGCEVHRFDPSRQIGPHSGAGSRSIQHHQAWLDWRNPRGRPHKGIMGSVPRRLIDIMDSLGHSVVDVVRADLESAEWRVLESWLKDGTLRRINQLILTIHLQWAGFEVSGADEEVVRFWYSILSSLYDCGFRLIRSSHGPGHTILRHTLPHTHSSYTLTWIRITEQVSFSL